MLERHAHCVEAHVGMARTAFGGESDVAQDLDAGRVRRGTMNIDMRSWGGASGSVTAMTIRKSAQRALEENHFSPLMTQWSPRGRRGW